MTPKDKAIELVNKFHNQFSETDTCFGVCEDEVKKGTCNGTGHGCYLWKPKAKQCALIAVDEILHCEATEPSDTDWDDCGATAQYYWPQKKVDAGKFWGDVKTELQSL